MAMTALISIVRLWPRPRAASLRTAGARHVPVCSRGWLASRLSRGNPGHTRRLCAPNRGALSILPLSCHRPGRRGARGRSHDSWSAHIFLLLLAKILPRLCLPQVILVLFRAWLQQFGEELHHALLLLKLGHLLRQD